MDLVQTAVGDGATKLLIRENMAGCSGCCVQLFDCRTEFYEGLKKFGNESFHIEKAVSWCIRVIVYLFLMKKT